MIFALILALVLAILSVFFALQNTAVVTVIFFGYSLEGSMALFILVALGVGALIGILFMLPGRIKTGIALARKRREVGGLEKTVDEHKTKLEELQKQKTETTESAKTE